MPAKQTKQTKPCRDAAGPIEVMLVSDFPVLLWGLEHLVQSHQPCLSLAGVARSRADILSMAGEAVPDVILIDLDGEHSADTIRTLRVECPAKVLAMTGCRDCRIHDDAMLAGANGVISKTEPVEVLLKAIECVHAGEIWIDRMAVGRILVELGHKKVLQEEDPEWTKIARLTRKERHVAVEIGRNASASTQVIAERLHISQNTLRNHLTSIYAKLEVVNRLELYAYANRYGMTEGPV